MCHQYARGQCKHNGDACDYGLHRKPSEATSTPLRGDGFRPYTTDTAMEIELKKHLATLMLSPFCEDLVDLDVKTLDTLYRMLASKRHPDKHSSGASGERFVQLKNAKDYVEKRLPFSM